MWWQCFTDFQPYMSTAYIQLREDLVQAQEKIKAFLVILQRNNATGDGVTQSVWMQEIWKVSPARRINDS